MQLSKCIFVIFIFLTTLGILLFLGKLQVLNMRKSRVPLLEYKASPPRLILISLDGFRADYLDPQLTPNMYEMASREGVIGHMVASFCTKTFPNHHTMATGLYQETHGIVHNNRHIYDAQLGARFVDLEDGKSDHWWDNGVATPIYIANQLEDSSRASCCAPWIGCHVRYLGGRERAYYHRHFNRSDKWEEQFEWAVKRMVSYPLPANLVMLYIPEPDASSHVHGPFSEQALNKVSKLDHFIGFVRQRLSTLGLLSTTNVLIVSDHGIAEISPKRMLILEEFLNSSWYDVYGCSPVLHLKVRAGFDRVLSKALEAAERQVGHFIAYRKEKMPERLHYRHHHRIQDYVLVAEEGWSLHPTRKEADLERHHRGQHGYDNLAPSMRPLFMAMGPSFKKGHLHPNRFNNVDLYPLMLRLLDINPKAHYHEGNFSNVAAMLRN